MGDNEKKQAYRKKNKDSHLLILNTSLNRIGLNEMLLKDYMIILHTLYLDNLL